MRMNPHFLAVIVHVYFPSSVSKDYVCQTHGLADCFECLSALYDCAVPQVLNKAAPLECSERASIVAWDAFYRHLFLQSSEYIQKFLSGLGFWLIQWMYTYLFTNIQKHTAFLSSRPLHVAREKALCWIGEEWSRLHLVWREYIESGVVFVSLLLSQKGCNDLSVPASIFPCYSVNYKVGLRRQHPLISVLAVCWETLYSPYMHQ